MSDGGDDAASADQRPIDIYFRPQSRSASLPVETFRRSEMLARMPAEHFQQRQRAHFHQLVVCIGGSGRHRVDFESHDLQPGTALRIRPGQNQQFDLDGDSECLVVVWPAESQPDEAWHEPWFPGGASAPTRQLNPDTLSRVETWVDELATEQANFTGSRQQVTFMRTVLRGVLLLVERSEGDIGVRSALPEPYVDLRAALEADLFARPTVAALARRIGYSTRTLDRACAAVSGQTARQVVDERLALELRRQLADHAAPLADVRRAFGFDDTSNFTKFVRRQLGSSPAEIRAASA